MASLADLEWAYYLTATGLPASTSLTDLQRAYFITQTGLSASTSLTDLKRAYYIAQTGLPASTSLADLERAYYLNKMSLPTTTGFDDSKYAFYLNPPAAFTPTIADDFNRADNAADLGSTSVGSVLWEQVAGNVLGISSNKAYLATANNIPRAAEVECGSADGTISCILPSLATLVDSSTFVCGLFARRSSTPASANADGLIFGSNAATWYLDWLNTSGTSHIQASGPAPAAGAEFKLRMSGTTFTAFINGTQVATFNQGAPLTGTKHGVYVGFQNANARVDDFKYFTQVNA